MAQGVPFSDDERIHALAVLEAHGGRVREAAAELGISHSALITWRNLGIAASGAANTKIDAEAWAEVQRLGAELLRDQIERAMDSDERLPARDVRDYAIAAGIAADKYLDFRDGRKGTQVNVDARSLTLPQGLTLEQLQLIAFAPPALEAPSDTTT